MHKSIAMIEKCLYHLVFNFVVKSWSQNVNELEIQGVNKIRGQTSGTSFPHQNINKNSYQYISANPLLLRYSSKCL